jgi:hypothetical protein
MFNIWYYSIVSELFYVSVLVFYPFSEPVEQVSALILVKINLPLGDILLFTAANYNKTESRKMQQCKEHSFLVTIAERLIFKLFDDAVSTTDVI